jgi:hypothetical protein
MKRMTRRQALARLAPIRRALADVRAGEVDSIRGYPVTRLNAQDDYARLDWCLNGFLSLLQRLEVGLDLAPGERLSKRLASGVLLTVGEVDAVLALLNQAENKLVGMSIDKVRDAVQTEQVAIELDSLGLRKAA